MKKVRKSKGFTLAEMLIVVAIIGILLAVAIPNVIGYYRSLKLTELDDSARTIFVAAQNRLTAMKSAGANLYALSNVEVNEKPNPGIGTGRFLAVTSAQADSLASLVPGGSIESQLHDNHYVVEIDAKTGAVYAVWYWEKEDFDYVNESYDEVKPEKDKRLDAGRMVGYYGGSFVDRPTIGQTPMPSAQVINAEELKLKISVPGFATGTYAVIKANVTISAGGKTVPIVPDVLGSQGVDLVLDPYNNVFEGEIALDTLDESTYSNMTSAAGWSVGKSFKNWVKDLTTGTYAIAPGANIDIEVKVTAVDTSGSTDPVNYLPQYLYWEDVNSLFASVEEDSVTGEPVTAHIAYGRHLQNLDSDTSGVTNTITAAEQTRNIDFDDNGSGIQSWDDTYKDDTTGDDGHTHQTFHAINNDNLANFNGANKTIKNLNVDETGVAGLFGSFGAGADDTISDVTLINAKVSGGDNTGALIGETTANPVTVSGCKVYLENYTVPTTIAPYIESTGGAVGGLIGSAKGNVTISKSTASTVISGSAGTGGLVGGVNTGVTLGIEQSYAANYLSGGSSIGGLVAGNEGDVTVNNSYAAGIIAVTGGGSVAGIMPRSSGSVSESYAAVRYVKDAAATAAIYGVAQNGTAMTNNAFYVEQTGITYESSSGECVSMSTLKAKIGTAPFDDTEWYNPGAGVKVNPQGLTVPYNILKEGLADPYPYPMLASDITAVGGASLPMPHYGDWLEETASAQSLCYYDLVDGSYGVWGYIADPANPGTPTFVNTLQAGTPNSGICATDDGYCIPVEKIGGTSTAPAAPTVDGITGISVENTPVGTYTDSTTSKTYDLYKVNGLEGVGATNYYNKITVGTTEYYFNPFFACEILTTDPGTANINTPQAKPETNSLDPNKKEANNYNGKVIIRTARQLANLAAATGAQYNQGTTSQQAAQNRNYVQLLDIDYDKYTGADLTVGTSANKQTPASLNSGSYDGNNFLIRNLYIGDGTIGDGTGLFGRSKGNMSNIRLVNISVESTDNNKYVGALAGRFQGDTFTNCGVYVDSANAPAGISDVYGTFKVSGSNDRVGGLIGNLNSDAGATVTKCFAAVKVEGGGDRVGGLIGALAASNNDSVLVDCYSAGHTVGSTYTNDANVTGDQQVGGLIGCVVGSSTRHTVTLSGINYSTCSVKGSNNLGLLIGAQTEQAEIVVASGGTAYATGVAFNNSGAETTPRNETYLTKPTVTTKSALTTHAYDDTLTGDYPYETNLNEHYGDWVMPKFQVSGYIYWELEGGAYHYSVTAWDREKGTAAWGELSIGSTLCNEYDTTGINNYGYGWFYAGDFDGSTPTMTGTTATQDTDAANALESSLKTALETALPGVDLGTVTVTAYSYNSTTPVGQAQTWNINIDGTSPAAVTLNPDFADTITTGGTVATPYKVRTIYQLQHINHTAYLDKTFEQGHDLDGTGVTDYVPIGNGAANGFTGSYDGQSYRILELSITPPNTVKNAALFASVYGGTVENVILYSPSGEAEIIASTANGAANAAGIVGDLYGNDAIVSNCAVAGYTITVNNPSTDDSYSQCIGGIAGWVSSNARITNCEAVVELVNKRASGGRALMNGNTTGAFMGGITGAVSDGGSVNITNCYAGGTIRNEASMSGGSNPYISAGGIVGLHQGSNMLTVSNCYSYMVWSGDVGTQTGQTGRYPIVNIINPYYSSQTSDYNAKLSNTYYIQGVQEGSLWNTEDTSTTQSNLDDCMKDSGGNYLGDFGTANAAHTFHPSATLTGAYPYPAVVKDHEGEYVHYGDWPTP